MNPIDYDEEFDEEEEVERIQADPSRSSKYKGGIMGYGEHHQLADSGPIVDEDAEEQE